MVPRGRDAGHDRLAKMRAAFEAASVQFFAENEERSRSPAVGSGHMTPEQCMEARRLLGWSRERLEAFSELP